MFKDIHQKGFTLIELLVVISIIGGLSAVVLPSLNSARLKARDAKRKESMTQLSRALEMYYSDNGQYPIGIFYSVWDSPQGPQGNCWCGHAGGNNTAFKTALITGKYIPSLPTDPSNVDYTFANSIGGGTSNFLGFGPGGTLGYIYSSDNGQRYFLGANLEGGNMPTGVAGNTITTNGPQICTLYGNFQLTAGTLTGYACPGVQMEG